MTKEFIQKVAMFFGGLALLDEAISQLIPSMGVQINDLLTKSVMSLPFGLSINTLTMISSGILGLIGAYLIYEVFNK